MQLAAAGKLVIYEMGWLPLSPNEIPHFLIGEFTVQCHCVHDRYYWYTIVHYSTL